MDWKNKTQNKQLYTLYTEEGRDNILRKYRTEDNESW